MNSTNWATHAKNLDQKCGGVVLQFWNGLGLPALRPGCVAVQMDDNNPLTVIFTCHEADIAAAQQVADDFKRENMFDDNVVVRTLPVAPAVRPVFMLDAEEADEWDYMMDAMMGGD